MINIILGIQTEIIAGHPALMAKVAEIDWNKI